MRIFEEYLAETERLLAGNDQRGLYKNLKEYRRVETAKPETRAVYSIRGDDGTLLRDTVQFFERWVRVSYKSFECKIIERLSYNHRPIATTTA